MYRDPCRKRNESGFFGWYRKCVTGYHHLKESFEDSKMALEYINIIRKIIGDKNKAVVDCSKLGIFYAFIKMKDKEGLWTYIPDSVSRLYQYDVKNKGELINTLECFLDNNQSLKRLHSKCLFIIGRFPIVCRG